jgi:hypothetical protein
MIIAVSVGLSSSTLYAQGIISEPNAAIRLVSAPVLQPNGDASAVVLNESGYSLSCSLDVPAEVEATPKSGQPDAGTPVVLMVHSMPQPVTLEPGEETVVSFGYEWLAFMHHAYENIHFTGKFASDLQKSCYRSTP